ncbi:metallophosphoesterase [Streptomyces montanus]|uniref:Metallophosphoesterase n=1 Tax=Streptomyces montanus TaxID=2580423 RepID=A0A5R9FJH6_9ACTN|nr:SAV_2336 N-terminal domain-related protein [Streptomyces montanus]TLS42230.1 metallophosphoesterase [Streptomyces montanus]
MTAQAPDTAPTDGASPELVALVARMREADIPPGVEELADALWLARWLPAPAEPPAEPSSGPPSSVPRPGDSDGSGTLRARLPSIRGQVGGEAEGEAEEPDSARLFAPGAGGEGRGARMVPVRVPAAPALPEPLALQRGLRPLQRYRPPVRSVPRTLDERATAQRAAESGLVLPVLRAERRREARLLLLMDVSTSTVVWQQALDELRQVCERAGAFREVQVQYLHEAADGLPGCAATPERAGPLHAPEQLTDPTGRRLTLVLSDCAGPMWRSGRMQRLLSRWASVAPVAVVQPLPQRMWLRTHLPARRGMLHRREGPAGTLEFTPERGRAERGALPVPVLALRRHSVEGWARLIAGSTGQSLSAAAGWVRADHTASSAPVRATEDITGEERVRAFWRPASQEARRLAVYLSAVPLYLPVMQLVQYAMLAGTGPDVLSEVLLSGLLKRREDADDPRAVRYDFLPGVAGELRARLAVDEVELLFKHCSEYVERRFGRSARNFPALAGAFLRGAVEPPTDAGPLSGPDEREPAGLRAFAEVSAEVLRDLGQRLPSSPLPPMDSDELVGKGRAAFERYEREGLTRELDAAVGYFEEALSFARTTRGRDRAAEELAEALLARWRVRRVVEDLRDALAAAERAGTVRGSLLRGLIYSQYAEPSVTEGLSEELPEDVRRQALELADARHPARRWAFYELVRRADTELSRVLDDTSTAAEAVERRRIAAERLPVIRDAVARAGASLPASAEAGGEHEWYTAHLVRAIEAAGVRLEFPDPESGHMARGGLRLALARYYLGRGEIENAPEDVDKDRARELAGGATDDFMAAVRSPDALPDEERCRAWLGVASAIEIVQSSRGEDGRGRPAILQAVDQALLIAGDNTDLRFECHVWAARTYLQRYFGTGRGVDINWSITAWEEAVALLDEDDTRRAGVLVEYGTALYERSTGHLRKRDMDAAVRALRAAVDATPEGDPELPDRRLKLGYVYRLRYGWFSHVLADLYEADWILGEAARGAGTPHVAMYSWLERGHVAKEISTRTGNVSHLHRAAEYYLNAAQSAQDTDDRDAALDARESRAKVFEQLNAPDRALTEYREALHLTEDRTRTEVLRHHITRLESETADE